MPRHKYIGTLDKNNILFKSSNKYCETIVSFKDIGNNEKMKKIQKPSLQGALIETKYEEMYEEYKNNPEFFRMKNKIIIGVLHDNWYLIDGQHRIQMITRLYNNSISDDAAIFCWFECKNDRELRDLFNSLNKDSIKNNYYLSLDERKQMTILDFNTLLVNLKKKNQVTIFSRNKSNKSQIYCIEEIIQKLSENGFFELMECEFADDAFKYLIKKNNEFYDKYYPENFKMNPTSFYSKDKIVIENSKIVFSIKNNNFYEWLFNSRIIPCHIMRKFKKPINKTLRNKVWKKYNGNEEITKCPIKNCKNIINNTKKNGWECGHITSEKNGGETIIDNLRPICQTCNKRMSSKNWEDFENSLIVHESFI